MIAAWVNKWWREEGNSSFSFSFSFLNIIVNISRLYIFSSALSIVGDGNDDDNEKAVLMMMMTMMLHLSDDPLYFFIFL